MKCVRIAFKGWCKCRVNLKECEIRSDDVKGERDALLMFSC